MTAATLDPVRPASAPTAPAAAPALPVIDLSALDDAARRTDFLAQLARTARDTGFFYLEGHGITETQLQAIAQASRDFFVLPPEAKQAIAMRQSRHFRGYTAVGGELTRQQPDLREQIDFGEELAAVPPGPEVPVWRGLQGPNQWPPAQPGLRPVVLDWLQATQAVAHRLLQAFVLALGQRADALQPLVQGAPNHRLKLIRYPGQPAGQSDQGVGAHKDGGILTLLLQDAIGGLQVQTPQGWLDVPPRPGAFVVNIGEMLELATNGYLRANVHRVVSPRPGVDRYSIAYFYAASLDAAQVPLLALPAALADLATGPESDPDNPLFRHVGTNALKGRVRSHLDVAQRFYPEQFAQLQAQAQAQGRTLQASAY